MNITEKIAALPDAAVFSWNVSSVEETIIFSGLDLKRLVTSERERIVAIIQSHEQAEYGYLPDIIEEINAELAAPGGRMSYEGEAIRQMRMRTRPRRS